MGLSHAAAAGVLFIAAALAGFQVSGDSFDQQARLAEAWSEYHSQERARGATSFTIDDVRKQGSDTELTATNTGSTTIDASRLTWLLDGVPVVIESYQVNGQNSAVWAPGSELVLLHDVWVNPDDVVLVDENGVKAYWRK